jgi:hypothetical protein
MKTIAIESSVTAGKRLVVKSGVKGGRWNNHNAQRLR